MVGKVWQKTRRQVLFPILLFALVTRLVNINHPRDFYFDEVYHAFTAQEILAGNPQAWEFWTTPPEGFAYEWTHPPLAKLLMAGGMFLFGQNPVGWRLPGVIAGVLSVCLVYFLGKELFKKKKPAFLAAALFSLDGLPLVMSRIGMNDIYFLAFALLAILLFFKEKHFWAAFAFGLAVATKWTAFFVLPILAVSWVLYQRRLSAKFLWYLAVPPVVYLFSYIPFFISGHSITQWWETQQQMWWYHTSLTATHSYQSSWWSWPLMLRPVWFFVESSRENIANIYAMGNPLVFWGGLLAVLAGIVSFVKSKNTNVLFLLIGYFIFFLPWAFSPRIMFLYHYLPSIPFMVLLLGWFIDKLWRRRHWAVLPFLILTFALFIFFYPHWSALPIPREFDQFYYWFSSWR